MVYPFLKFSISSKLKSDNQDIAALKTFEDIASMIVAGLLCLKVQDNEEVIIKQNG